MTLPLESGVRATADSDDRARGMRVLLEDKKVAEPEQKF